MFCKHMVATSLVANDYHKAQREIPWMAAFGTLLDTVKDFADVKQSKPYLLFFSLQKRNSDWGVIPYTIRAENLIYKWSANVFS